MPGGPENTNDLSNPATLMRIGGLSIFLNALRPVHGNQISMRALIDQIRNDQNLLNNTEGGLRVYGYSPNHGSVLLPSGQTVRLEKTAGLVLLRLASDSPLIDRPFVPLEGLRNFYSDHGRNVNDVTLRSHIARTRGTLGDPQVIESGYRKGYRLRKGYMVTIT